MDETDDSTELKQEEEKKMASVSPRGSNARMDEQTTRDPAPVPTRVRMSMEIEEFTDELQTAPILCNPPPPPPPQPPLQPLPPQIPLNAVVFDMMQILLALQLLTNAIRPLWNMGAKLATLNTRKRLAAHVISVFTLIVGQAHAQVSYCRAKMKRAMETQVNAWNETKRACWLCLKACIQDRGIVCFYCWEVLGIGIGAWDIDHLDPASWRWNYCDSYKRSTLDEVLGHLQDGERSCFLCNRIK